MIHLKRNFWRAWMSSLRNASQGWVERERIDFRDDPAAGATVVTSPCLQTRAARHPSYSRGMGLFSGSLYIKVRACADAGPCHCRSCSVHAACHLQLRLPHDLCVGCIYKEPCIQTSIMYVQRMSSSCGMCVLSGSLHQGICLRRDWLP